MIAMRWIVGTLLLLNCAWLAAQTPHFEIKSGTTKLKILTDVTPPLLTLNPTRNIEKGYRFVQRDTTISLIGTVDDASGMGSLQVNGVITPVTPSGKFCSSVRLVRGKNLILLRAMDRKNNTSNDTVIVYQDSNADTTAPQISIIQPSLGRGFIMVMKTPTLQVSGTTADQSPLAALYINNVRIDSARTGPFHCEVPTEGLRVVNVRAVDSCGNVAADSVVLPIHYFSGESENIQLPTTGKYFALLIGVDKYPYSDNLKNPVRDASKLGSILRSVYTFEKENIVLLKNPTRDRILEGFEEMKGKIGSEDNFLVFYAGHGYMDGDAEQGYWWPTDANPGSHSKWISNSDIRDQVRRIKSKHTLLIADACFSGSVFQTTREALDNAPIPIIEDFRRSSRTALTSGGEAVPDESLFTRLLFRALEEYPFKYLRGNSLHYLLKDEVISNSPNRQEPEYGEIRQAGHAGGDFVFVKRDVENSKPNH
jgi:hypothetical protein